MTEFVEGPAVGAFILSEASGQRSRENIVISASQTISPGTILALLASAGGVTTAYAHASDNTGNSTLAFASPAVSSKAKNGKYLVIFTAATAFKVEDPNGSEIGTGTVGSAFNKEIKFTITAGGTAHVAGDVIEISVGVETPGDLVAVALDPTATDGSEKAGAIAIYPAKTGVGETAKIATIFRDAEVNGKCLDWDASWTAAQKAQAIADLAASGIVVR